MRWGGGKYIYIWPTKSCMVIQSHVWCIHQSIDRRYKLHNGRITHCDVVEMYGNEWKNYVQKLASKFDLVSGKACIEVAK